MQKEHWQKIEEIFHAAADYHGSEREEYLRVACKDDQATLLEIAELLKEHENPSTSLEISAIDIGLQIFDKQEFGGRTGEWIGHLRIGHLIGRGGMGEIYAADDTKNGRKVAIKLVNELFALDPERIRRFRKEANAASRVSHPNVAKLYELCEVHDEHLIVMELVDGINLRRHMAVSIPLEEALNISIQIASALVAAHAVGVVHRDIKPENIIITPDGTVKVLDFGLAKLVDPIGEGAIHIPGGENAKLTVDMSTELGALIGTPAYMSPEQIRGADVDTQTDIWSLGVLLYEMLSGELPFRGSTKIDMIAAVLISDPPRVQVNDNGGKANTVLRKALAKDKSDRYRNASELIADLRALKCNIDAGDAGHSSVRRIRAALKYAALIILPAAVLIAALASMRQKITWYLYPKPRPSVSVPLPVTEGLVSYWPADGNADDIVGGNNGTLLNGAGYREGINGQAFSFDGVDDLMDAPSIGLPTGDHPRTLAMWACVDAFVTQVGTFGRYGGSGVKTRTYGMGVNGVYLFFSNWGRSWEAADDPLQPGKWYHVVATSENGLVSLYLDGKLITTESVVLDTTPGSRFEAGGYPEGREFLKGAVDDIIVYNRSLSAAEVSALYTFRAAGHPSTPPDKANLVGYWSADGNARDGGTGRNDAVLMNGASYTAGIKGQAFSFDGVDDYVQATTNKLPLGGSDRSMMLWVKATDFVAANGSFAGYGKFGSDDKVYQLGLNGGTFPLFWNWGGGTGARIALEKDRWYFVATSSEKGVTSLYVDGALAGTTDVRLDTAADTFIYFGGVPGELGKTRRFKGALDEIAVYDRALSAAEIQAIYSSVSNASPPSSSLDSVNLVGYWSADGNGRDSGTGRNDAVLMNGASYTPGIKGQAFRFDGVDDYVQAPTNKLPIGGSDRSMALWAKADDFVTVGANLAGYGNSGTDDQAYGLGLNGKYPIFSNWGGGIGAGDPIETGRWYHIATSTKAGITSFYVDGVLIGTTDVRLDTPADTTLYFGSVPGPLGKTRRLKGAIDEIAVYDRALSAEEIQTLFSAYSPPN